VSFQIFISSHFKDIYWKFVTYLRAFPGFGGSNYQTKKNDTQKPRNEHQEAQSRIFQELVSSMVMHCI
jgi:hypothetical protein